jgi:hypothetical protein
MDNNIIGFETVTATIFSEVLSGDQQFENGASVECLEIVSASVSRG